MNIEQMKVFDAVVRLGSFNAAAKVLNRVPSAVSYAVKTLEQDFGVLLFDRETYRPQLTPAGQAIHRKVQLVLGEMSELGDLATKLGMGQEPLIHLDISPICPTNIFTPALRQIAQEFPKTQFKISMEIFGGEALVLHREADITLTDQMNRQPQLESQAFMAIPMVAVVAPCHPLGRNERQPVKRDMKPHFQIVVRNQTSHLRHKTFGVLSGGQTWMVNDFPTKHQLIREGLGWGHLPQTMIAEDLENGKLARLNIDFMPKTTAKLRLVRMKADTHGPVASRMWELLTLAIPDVRTSALE